MTTRTASQSPAAKVLIAFTILIGFVAVVAAIRMIAHGRSQDGETLTHARAGFVTRLIAQNKNPDPLPPPPPGVFTQVTYPAPLGSFPAYVSVPPTRGKRYPAIVWLTGGFSNSIGDTPWTPAEPDNDQSGSAFRNAGIVMMYPSLRGGNNNPGYNETFYGEVDDVLAAAKYLSQQPFVDPKRIYLGGHSTGGTLALLADESTDQFRAVFSFGPVSRPTEYGTSDLTFDPNNGEENRLRSPIEFLSAIHSPTYIIEGTADPSNIEPLKEMKNANNNPQIHFMVVDGKDHFSELASSTPTVARWIAGDTGANFQTGSPQ